MRVTTCFLEKEDELFLNCPCLIPFLPGALENPELKSFPYVNDMKIAFEIFKQFNTKNCQVCPKHLKVAIAVKSQASAVHTKILVKAPSPLPSRAPVKREY